MPGICSSTARAGVPGMGFPEHEKQGLSCVRRVLNLAAGVSYEDRQNLLGRKIERITTHYSAPDKVLAMCPEQGVNHVTG